MLLAGAVRGVPGIAIPVRLRRGSCQHADQMASQAARCVRSFRSRLAYWHCLPGHLDPLVGGVDVDELFAGPAEVFTCRTVSRVGAVMRLKTRRLPPKAAAAAPVAASRSRGQPAEGAGAILDVHP